MQEKTNNQSPFSDKRRFLEACQAVTGVERSRSGIGTLSEKTLHAVIKRFIEPEEALCEVKHGGYYADVRNANGIFEIQTRAFNKLRAKLEFFLESGRVTVVYPLPAVKRLIWIDMETGELSAPRKSPKRFTCFDAFAELYKLGPLIAHNELRILLLFIDMDEYRCLNGWSADGKKGSTRSERIPLALEESVLLCTNADYLRLLPETLGDAFTSAELASSAKINRRTAQVTLTVLAKRGAIACVGKRGRMKLYAKCPPPAMKG